MLPSFMYYFYLLHLKNPQSPSSFMERRKSIFPLAIASFISLFLLFLTTLNFPHAGAPLLRYYYSTSTSSTLSSIYAEPKLKPFSISDSPPPPRLAHLNSGSAVHGRMVRRTLEALYHPINQYIVHLDVKSSTEESLDLYSYITAHPIFHRFQNVQMITKTNLVTYRGLTMVTNTLHVAATFFEEKVNRMIDTWGKEMELEMAGIGIGGDGKWRREGNLSLQLHIISTIKQ